MGYRGTGKGWTSSHGYRLKALGNSGGREYEHRLIASKALGRDLLKAEEVHHVEDKDNDKGLVVCGRAYHKYLHFMERVRSLGFSRNELIRLHHVEGLPLEEIKRRLGLGEGMIGRWFKRMNIEIRKGVGGRGSILYKSRVA